MHRSGPGTTSGAMRHLALLPDRAVLEVTGEDRVSFLQGLVSNDVADAHPGRAVWAALLTPQGKWLADFFILSDGARLLLDCGRAQSDDLQRRLTRFRLRAKVAVAPGIGFGEHGDSHVRIALVENTQRLRQAVRSIRTFLAADSNVAPGTVAAADDRVVAAE